MARRRSHTRHTARSNPRGRIEMHRGGYGFVQTAEGEFFVPRKNTRGAFPDDIVEIAPIKRSDARRRSVSSSNHKRVARVTRVVERAHDQLIGYFRHAEPFGIVEPVDPLITHDIFTVLAENPDIPDGAIVRVAITTFPDRNTAATGQVIEVLGDEDDERVAIDLIVARNKLETTFSEAALAEAASAQVDAEGALAEDYRDLRKRVIFTIDPADARDFDDAVSLDERPADGAFALADALDAGTDAWPPEARWRLGVHIADVSHYVPWGCSIDLDARRRATSTYLVDRVIPMLPEELSNDICSLRPNEERRTMTVDLYLTASGEVIDARPYPALIRSAARLTYEQAQHCIDKTDGVDIDADQNVRNGVSEARLTPDFNEEETAPSADAASIIPIEVQQRICALSAIARKRMKRRESRGGLDFDTAEAKVRLDDEGYPLGIDLRTKTDATQLIEEAMIMANEAIARYLRDAGFPCLYRIHDQPDHDALDDLIPVLGEFSWFKNVNEAHFVAGNPHAIQKVLRSVKGRPEDTLVTTLVLRSMKRAVYSPQLASHYGLASDAYAHFTSPIRRYPDLVVHRMLRAALLGRPEKFDQEAASMSWLAEHSSEMERVAERAARESQEVKIIELMEARIGETFSGLVSGVASFGLFVQLDNTAEGVIEMGDLGNEYFILDPMRHMLIGSDTGKQYQLGKRIAVRLVEADRRTRQLRFRLVK